MADKHINIKLGTKFDSSGVDQASRALGRLPGMFGKIQSAASGMAAKIMAVFGALKLGIDIGNWIQEKVIAPLLGIKDPIEELKKENREIEQSWKKAASAFDEAMSSWERGWQMQVRAVDKVRQGIEDTTQAYLKMQQARERGISATDSAKILGMERDKFAAMSGAATPEEAAALGMRHDIRIAEERAAQQLAKFDRDSETAAKRQAAAEEELKQATEKRVHLKREMAELDKKLAYTQSQQSVYDLGFEASSAEEKKLQARKDKLQKEIDDADRDAKNRRADLDAIRESRMAEAQERQNMKDRAQLEVDERRRAYGEYLREVAAEETKTKIEMERKAAAERDRLDRELHQKRMADIRAEIKAQEDAAAALSSVASAAQSEFDRAFAMYRDPTLAASQIAEERDYAADMKRLHRDASRYGGKWRIDELSALMSAGDAHGVQSRLEEWRKSRSFTPEVEAMVRASAAEQTKTTVEDELRKIEKNTSDLAGKLESLISMKGE